MSDTKSFILEYYTFREQKFDPLGFLNKNKDQSDTSLPTSLAGSGGSSSAGGGGGGAGGGNQSGGGFNLTQALSAIPLVKQMGDDFTKGAGQEAERVGTNLIGTSGQEAERVGTNLLNTGTTALTNVARGATSDAEAALNRTTDRAISGAEQAATRTMALVPQTSRQAGSEFTKGVTSSLGKTFSDPKTLAKLGVGALATGALVGGGMALGNRMFGRRPEKKKKRSTAISLTASYNPYARTSQELGGAFGATSGSLGGLLGGRYVATKAADALGLKQGGIGRTALEIGGQALGTVAGGTLGGMAGWELGKKRKKKNEMLPQSMYS
jgi:hypothetical protein